MTIHSDLKLAGKFAVIENANGTFDVRDPYGVIECNRSTRESAQRIVDAANKAMIDYNNGARISDGGDI